jgi:hypothetical protein
MDNEIEVNGKKYVLASSVKSFEPAKELKGLKYVIIRTYSAGVFAGYLKEIKGKEATVLTARRLWYWDGASSLSQLSVDGVSKPQNCKFPIEVPEVFLTEVIEVLPCSKKAQESIASVKVWEQ